MWRHHLYVYNVDDCIYRARYFPINVPKTMNPGEALWKVNKTLHATKVSRRLRDAHRGEVRGRNGKAYSSNNRGRRSRFRSFLRNRDHWFSLCETRSTFYWVLLFHMIIAHWCLGIHVFPIQIRTRPGFLCASSDSFKICLCNGTGFKVGYVFPTSAGFRERRQLALGWLSIK